MNKAFIYCRVSTEEQAREGYSLEAQEKYCRRFAENSGYRVVAVYSDEGKSGTTLDRPALKEMLTRIQEERAIAAVLVQETDRLARNTRDHLTVRALLQKVGARLISVAQPMLDDSPEGNMIDTIIASVNQFQSDINSRKTKKGLQEKFDSGWWPGWAPLGYRNMDGDNSQKILVPDSERWHLVRRGLTMYLTGKHSAQEIADILYDSGLRSRIGKKVCNSIMNHMLRNPLYAGVMKWNGQQRVGRHKPMITPEEHQRILAVLDTHNLHACRRRRHRFLLSGLVFCNLCGAKYSAEIHPRKKAAYYQCAFGGKRGKDKPHGNQGQHVRVQKLEKQVEERFKGIQFSDDFTDLVLRGLKELHLRQKETGEAQKRTLLNRKLAIERRRDAAERKLLDGVISDQDFSRIRTKIDNELDQFQNQLDRLEIQHTYDVNVIRDVLKLARDIYHAYKKAPFELKREFLGLFWERFVVQDRRIVRAIPTRLIYTLWQHKKVLIRRNWLPSPTLIRTVQDREYMCTLKDRLAAISRCYRELGLSPALGT